MHEIVLQMHAKSLPSALLDERGPLAQNATMITSHATSCLFRDVPKENQWDVQDVSRMDTIQYALLLSIRMTS